METGRPEMKGWVYLAAAILLEVSGTTCMKLSQGFTHWVPSVLVFMFYALSFSAMIVALRQIDLSIAYAIWAGLGTALIALIGILWFGEPITMVKVVSLALIILGVVGLQSFAEA